MVDVTVRILGKFVSVPPATKNGDAIEDSDLVEDAIQLFFDKFGIPLDRPLGTGLN